MAIWQRCALANRACGNIRLVAMGAKVGTSKYSMACGNIRHVAMGAEVVAGKYGVRQYKTCGNGSRLQR